MSSSSKAQQPEILSTEELKTDAKWLKMEKINWKDQDGKEVSPAWKYTYLFRRNGVSLLTDRESGKLPTGPLGRAQSIVNTIPPE
jgi:hypothetical protein